MNNSRIINHEFEYAAPNSLSGILEILSQNDSGTSLLAGGTDLLVLLKQEKIKPRLLLDVKKAPELDFIEERKGNVCIGAAVSLTRIKDFAEQHAGLAGLYECLKNLAKVQVRNMGTLAGNLCNASPAADSAPILLAMGASVKLVSAESERTVALKDFFLGPRKTVLAANELMTEICIPLPAAGEGNAFGKLARVGSDISKVTCAVAVSKEGGKCARCRIAMGAVAPTPVRLYPVEEAVSGGSPDEALLSKAVDKLLSEINPIDDVRSTAEYRREACGVLFRDVFESAWQRAESTENE